VSCDGGTCYHGCACHEARWQERLAGAETRVRALEEGIRAAMDYSGNRWSEWGERAENVADMLDALLAPPPEAEKKGGE